MIRLCVGARFRNGQRARRVGVIFRNKNRDGFPNHFLGGIAENALSAIVPTADDSIKVLAENGIIGRFDNGSEMPEVVLCATENFRFNAAFFGCTGALTADFAGSLAIAVRVRKETARFRVALGGQVSNLFRQFWIHPRTI